MIYLDPQASLTISYGMNSNSKEFDKANICNLFDEKTNSAECAFSVEKSELVSLYLIP